MKPKIIKWQDTTYFGFTNTQVSHIRQQIELASAYKHRLEICESEIKSYLAEIELQDSSYNKVIDITDKLRQESTKQSLIINEQAIIIQKYKQSDRRAKLTKILYKITTFALAGTTVYLLLK